MGEQDRLLLLTPDAKLALHAFGASDENNHKTGDKPERGINGAWNPKILGVHLVRKALVQAKNLRFQRIESFARCNAMTTDLQKTCQNPVASN